MKYRVRISEKAKKDLRQMDKYQASLVVAWLMKNIDQCEDPRLHGRALTENLKGFWRYRVGNYRIICEIIDSELLVVVIKIGHRKNVYD